jgi:hypothetical protein
MGSLKDDNMTMKNGKKGLEGSDGMHFQKNFWRMG